MRGGGDAYLPLRPLYTNGTWRRARRSSRGPECPSLELLNGVLTSLELGMPTLPCGFEERDWARRTMLFLLLLTSLFEPR